MLANPAERPKAWEVPPVDNGEVLQAPPGGDDEPAGVPLWEEIAPTLPTATLRVFSESGHQPFYEEPEEFARVVSDWIE